MGVGNRHILEQVISFRSQSKLIAFSQNYTEDSCSTNSHSSLCPFIDGLIHLLPLILGHELRRCHDH